MIINFRSFLSTFLNSSLNFPLQTYSEGSNTERHRRNGVKLGSILIGTANIPINVNAPAKEPTTL